MARSDPPRVTQLSIDAALKLANMVVERRTTIPVLECVEIDPTGVIRATDLDMTLSVPFDGGAAGLSVKAGITVVAHNLAAAAKEVGGPIQEEVETGKRLLRIGQNPTVRLRVLEDDLPQAAEVKVDAAFALNAGDLATDLKSVSPAMSSEETRYYLMGMFWHLVDGHLRFAATDGHRLHRVSRPAPAGLKSMPDALVPAKTIRVLAAMIDGQKGVEDVTIEVAKTRIRFTVGDAVLTSRLIDGTFPDYSRVIPKDAGAGMRLAAQEIVRPSTLAAKLMRRRVLAVVLRPQDATLRAKDPDGVAIAANLERELLDGGIEQVAFRHEYLVDALTPFLGAQVEMRTKSSADPCSITSPDNDHLLVVLMPVRV